MNPPPIAAMVPSSRPEVRLMLCCARRALRPPQGEQVSAILRERFDWTFLTESSIRHGLLPLLFRNLKGLARSADGTEVRLLARHFMVHAARSQWLAEELAGWLDRLAADGIAAVPYKGPALAAMAYGDLSMRISGDLDLLVRQGDVPAALRRLTEQGYRLHKKAIGRTRFDPRRAYHLEFAPPAAREGQKGRPPVELHWGLGDDIDFPADMALWWRRLIDINLGGRPVRVFPPEETVVSLCIHGSKDLWNRLILVADVAELIRSAGRFDWQRVLELTPSADSRRMLFMGLLLARDLLALEVPPEIGGPIDRDLLLERLARRVAQRLLAGQTIVVRPPERIPFSLALRHRWRERTRYLANYLRVVITPDEDDLRFVRLPRGLSASYYLVRPVRRSVEYLRQAWQAWGRRR